MNERIRQIVTIILNNRILVVNTNIKWAWEEMLAIEPTFWKYDRLYKRLQKNDYTTFEVENKTYHIEIKRNN